MREGRMCLNALLSQATVLGKRYFVKLKNYLWFQIKSYLLLWYIVVSNIMLGKNIHIYCQVQSMWHVICDMWHISYVRCHMSHVTCHILFILLLGTKWLSSSGRVCYQRGLPRLVYRFVKLGQMGTLADNWGVGRVWKILTMADAGGSPSPPLVKWKLDWKSSNTKTK